MTENDFRSAACVSAMEGIPDPAAYVKAMGEVVEALEAARVRLVRIAGRDFDRPPHQHGMAAAWHAQKGVHDAEAVLTAARAAMGEVA